MEHITWEKLFGWRKDKKMFKDKRDRAKLRLKLQWKKKEKYVFYEYVLTN